MMAACYYLITLFKQLCALTLRVWSDGRVPRPARIFLILALLYLICPFDLRSDFLPGGFIDDLVVVPLLIGLFAVLTPRIVFQEASRQATPALSGLICLIMLAAPARASNHDLLGGALQKNSSSGVARSVKMTIRNKMSGLACRTSPPVVRNGISLSLPLNADEKSESFAGGHPLYGEHGDFLLLITRAGQSQFYAAPGKEVLQLIDLLRYCTLPSDQKGGIFIVWSSETKSEQNVCSSRSIFGEGPCC